VQQPIEIRVPDIGDFKDVPIIEMLVAEGEMVAREQALLTIESDKATMEVPCPQAGRILSLKAKVGDKISRGSLIALLAAEEANHALEAGPDAVEAHAVAGDAAAADFDLAVIGGGPGGYSAAFRAADLGLRVALVERHKTLGGVCLNVGCIPSKALLHVAAAKEQAERLGDCGIKFAEATIDLNALRQFKRKTVQQLTDGLRDMAKARKVEVIEGEACFTAAHRLRIATSGGGTLSVAFKNCVIATGSSAVRLPMLPSHPRVVTSTGALDVNFVPERLLVVGGGIIGLEMATVYSALGSRVDVIERLPMLLTGVDPDAVRIWRKQNDHRFDRIMLGTSLDRAAIDGDRIVATIGGSDAASSSYDLVLQSAGRRPNSGDLGLELAGLRCDERGFIKVDGQMRTAVSHIFAIGDVVGGPMLAHKAVHEGHIAAEAVAGHKVSFDAKVVPCVAYTDPEIAWVGLSEQDAASAGTKVRTAKFPWAASGRAIASGASYGMTKLVFDNETRRIVGGVVVGPHAGDMIGEICLAIEMGADALDIGKTIHPHPTLGETIGMAAELFEGTCTDLPPPRGGAKK
jgi:dihydrolipoamide dehydrogenase